MSKAEFEAEKKYLLAITIAQNLREKGLLTNDEYQKIDEKLRAQYSPKFSALKTAFVSAANKALADKAVVIETFRLIQDSVLDISALEKEQNELTEELSIVTGLIQDGIYKNAHVAQNQSDYNREYETLTSRYNTAKSRLDEVESEIHDKNSRRKSIKNYLMLLEEHQDAITEFEVHLWHGLVDFVTVYSKNDIRFTMKDGTEIRV